MNKETKLILEYLDFIEFSVEKFDTRGYCLYDHQTGTIRYEKVKKGSELIEHLYWLLDDYILRALDDITDDDYTSFSGSELVKKLRADTRTSESGWDIDIYDLFTTDDIKRQNKISLNILYKETHCYSNDRYLRCECY